MEGLFAKYFVLKPKGADAYAIASRMAMRAYAEAIQKGNHVLSQDLLRWIKREEEEAGS